MCQGREAWTECVLWNMSHQGHGCVSASGWRGLGCWLKSWRGDFGLQFRGGLGLCLWPEGSGRVAPLKGLVQRRREGWGTRRKCQLLEEQHASLEPRDAQARAIKTTSGCSGGRTVGRLGSSETVRRPPACLSQVLLTCSPLEWLGDA